VSGKEGARWEGKGRGEPEKKGMGEKSRTAVYQDK